MKTSSSWCLQIEKSGGVYNIGRKQASGSRSCSTAVMESGKCAASVGGQPDWRVAPTCIVKAEEEQKSRKVEEGFLGASEMLKNIMVDCAGGEK
jgi:hypothetical protein